MYTAGTLVLFERRGVYQIERIGEPPLPSSEKGLYYELRSVFSNSNEIIYIPVDTAAFMRPLIDEKQAFEYLELSGHGKKLGQVDQQYLKLAERLVCEEFATVLHTTPETVKKSLYTSMRHKAAPCQHSRSAT